MKNKLKYIRMAAVTIYAIIFVNSILRIEFLRVINSYIFDLSLDYNILLIPLIIYLFNTRAKAEKEDAKAVDGKKKKDKLI